jgi:hypothetical protein
VVSRCQKGQCKLNLRSNSTVIDCDKCKCFGKEDKKPDFIALETTGGARWIVVEMKSKASHANDILDQLQAGADRIEKEFQKMVSNPPKELVPVILYKKGMHFSDLEKLAKGIKFLGKRVTVISRNCGGTLPWK